LQHPGVVPVHDVGLLEDGRPFIAMKLVKGRTLTQLLQGRAGPSDDLPRLLDVFARVCQTVAYAHSKGVLHRDLKPSNVMVGAFGEVQVMDWGLAKVLRPGDEAEEPAVSVIHTVRSDAAGAESEAGAVMGTPAYMAPEQARGEVEALDERCDVFGLGSILCEILTGQPPYTGDSSAELRRRAARADLADAWERLQACGADAELVQLARACLAAEKESRPRDAGGVAEAVTAYLHSVQARLRQAELERAAEAARAQEAQATAAAAQAKAQAERRARRLTLALAAALLLAGALGAAGWRWVELERLARDGRVHAALQEALRLRGVAQAAPLGNLASWAEAVAAARQAVELGEPGVDAALGQQAQTLLAEVADEQQQAEAAVGAAERDRQLLERLVDIRSAKADDPDGSATDSAFAEAFAAAGLDVAQGTPADVAAQLQARPPAVAGALAAALNYWAAMRHLRQDPAGARRLTEVAQAVDPHSLRGDFRAAMAQPDPATRRVALRRLAQSARLDELSAVGMDLLGEALAGSGHLAEAEAVLRAAQRRYPSDVWVNLDLALVLEKQGRREEAIRYYQAARALRPETAHELAHALEARGERDEAIAVFQDLARLRPKEGRHLACLSRALKARGRLPEAGKALDAAVAALQEQVRLNPDDALAHTDLGRALADKGRLDEAIGHFQKAIRLDPKDANAHTNLGNALQRKGRVDEAIGHFQKALQIDPKHAPAHHNLGYALATKGQLDEAIAEYRKALELDPKDAKAHTNLGSALQPKGLLDEAIGHYHQAIQLDPKDALAHNNLGAALAARGRLDEAIDHYHQALQIDSKYRDAHYNLGLALKAKGRVDEAIDNFHQALQIDPKLAQAHYNLGIALHTKGRLDEAIAEYRKVIDLDFKLAQAHYSLGLALYTKGLLDEAIVQYGQAIQLQPNDAEAHCNLGLALKKRGDFTQALTALKRGHELGSQRPGWRYPSLQWVRECERLLALEARLPAVLQDQDKPTNTAEQLQFADLCTFRKRYGDAARFYADAFTAQPKLADDLPARHRYNAACAAALAAAGQSSDTAKLDDKERARLRQQALAWLRADLAAWNKSSDRAVVQRTLTHWQRDPDLAGVRDKDALAKLPDAEREAWYKLWTDVADLLRKSGARR
jgi:serine/threonine-protein kinase